MLPPDESRRIPLSQVVAMVDVVGAPYTWAVSVSNAQGIGRNARAHRGGTLLPRYG